jgi:hypothetical protein
MSRKLVVRENFLHAQVHASAHYCYQHLPLFPMTTTKTIEPDLPQEQTVAKRHRESRPLLKSPKTEILVFPVLCQANWRAQGNGCVHYCAGQEEDDSEGPVCAFRRHHEYAQSRYSVRN